ncbi:hypothetical protein L1987_38929 [Smallanthus sonchifolius]|uniref:Uncharacterized protein n=1 Tax=Smallanthus sonchifolius TaxID=185202 RepID=A0ACB9HKV2_9ASTR|nr:hypothetical protein L1987_38929 [Smallanthus sonchifolius]
MERSNYNRSGSDGGNRGGHGGRNRNYQQGGGRGKGGARESGGLGRGRGQQTHRTPAYPGHNAPGGSTRSLVACDLQVHEVSHVEAGFATSLIVNTTLRYDVTFSTRPKSSVRQIEEKLCSSFKTAIMRWGQSAYTHVKRHFLDCIVEGVCA